ncbi:phosphatase PAP2 family protein [Salisediminibacterium selenitireducens]|uniref:Phosphoesterase PA-phosphatase related protein n=1 Tax=Bacillus selenitireducens (strain ATCC 700615 / DSM 15326 / MLS10) TaxID=439292 RepID=D6XZC0_BACIE|nr:phosphatase PAP2 family protein [Salisediminibacterium selenitireducens]ADI00405.1 phosphoesterase PA-phosphatase related protein [[Bacillus] selenitireducens MLS10]
MTITDKQFQRMYRGAALGAIAFFLLALDVYFKGLVYSLDEPVLNTLSALAPSWVVSFMAVWTDLGSVLVLTIGTLTLAAVLLTVPSLNRWLVVPLAVNMVGIAVWSTLIKGLVGRERPLLDATVDGTGFSFPSAHASGAMAFYGFLIVLVLTGRYPKRPTFIATGILGFLILSIAVSRLFLGVHYPTDMIGGLLLGFTWLLFSLYGYRRLIRKTGKAS